MIIAVDIGGTKTLVASFTGERSIVNEERFPTPQNEQAFLRELFLVLQRFDVQHAETVCVAVPGIIDSAGTVIRCGNLPWTNFELKNLLSKQLSCPVLVHNDAKLAGLAETHSLAEIPPLSVYVTVSTGIGTGIITNGQINDALANSEGGHMQIQTPHGFMDWEDFASGKAIRETFGRLAADIHDPAEWHQIVDNLALGFQNLIPLLQPQVIIIGGSIGTYFERYGTLLTEVLRHRLPNFIDIPKIVQAQHPEEAVVYGCYYYATHRGLARKA
jgi:predicted NBD/HSP70 family sugar kinase